MNRILVLPKSQGGAVGFRPRLDSLETENLPLVGRSAETLAGKAKLSASGSAAEQPDEGYLGPNENSPAELSSRSLSERLGMGYSRDCRETFKQFDVKVRCIISGICDFQQGLRSWQ